MSSRKRGGVPEEAAIPPRLEKDEYLSETALCVSGRYPKKADKVGEEGCSFSLRGSACQEREGHKKREKTEKKVPVPSAQDLKEKKGKLPRHSPAARTGDAIRVSAKNGDSYAEILKPIKAKVNP